MAHAYTAEAITRLVENGVKSIEHGLLIDDEAARLVKENGAVISKQLYIFRQLLGGDYMTEFQQEKAALTRRRFHRNPLIYLVGAQGLEPWTR